LEFVQETSVLVKVLFLFFAILLVMVVPLRDLCAYYFLGISSINITMYYAPMYVRMHA
jgi:hypothetical protein